MAIAFGSSADIGENGSTNSLSGTGPTVSGSNTYGVVVLEGDTSLDDITSMTWGTGNNMTLLVKSAGDGTGNTRYTYLYGIANPASAATIKVTSTNTHLWAVVAGYYTGVQQTGQPDCTATNSSDTGTATSLSVTPTIVHAGTWLIVAQEQSNSANGAPTTSTGSVRVTESTFQQPSLMDSNAGLSAGATTFTVNTPGGFATNINMAAAGLIPFSSFVPPKRLARSYYLPVMLKR